jgi:HEAT repeat protein
LDDLESLFTTIADPVTDEDRAWIAVVELQKTATRKVLEQATQLTTAADPRVRSRAASVLGQLGISARAFPDECFQALLGVLESARVEHVIDSAICAIGHLDDSRGIEPILRFARHGNEEIRFAVAFALGGRNEPQAIEALIAMTRDPAAKVRDWATFGIGILTDTNTPEMRDALFERLQDMDKDTQREAMCGLAHHGDRRVVQHLIDRLRDDPADTTILCAAGELLGWEDFRAENERLDEVLESLARLL